MIPFKGQALLESGSALLNIVGLEPKYETITYFICILSSIFLVVAAMLSFIAIFAVKTPKWITLVRIFIIGWNISIKDPRNGPGKQTDRTAPGPRKFQNIGLHCAKTKETLKISHQLAIRGPDGSPISIV